MTIERFPVEAGHIMLFARAIGDANPVYYGALTGEEDVPAPPTFVQASAQFDPDYFLRPKIGEPWFGSGRDATGVVREDGGGGAGGGGGGGLHAEQHYQYHRPLRAGDVLTATVRDGETWEKQGRRGGKLLFAETITEYRDQAGELVVTARAVGVRTEKVVENDGLTSRSARAARVVLVDDLTRTQIVQYAGASGDYNPLHTDDRFTKEVAGYPSVFAHGMLTMGMTGRVLTDWFGAEALDRVRRALREAGVAGRHAHCNGDGDGGARERRAATGRPHRRNRQPRWRAGVDRNGDRPPRLTDRGLTPPSPRSGWHCRHQHSGQRVDELGREHVERQLASARQGGGTGLVVGERADGRVDRQRPAVPEQVPRQRLHVALAQEPADPLVGRGHFRAGRQQQVAMAVGLQAAEEPDVGVSLFDLLGERHDERLHQVANTLSSCGERRIEQRQPPGVHLGRATFEDGDDEARLVAEVVLGGAVVALAGLQPDLAHRDAVDATLGEQPLGGVEEQLAGGDGRRHEGKRTGLDSVKKCFLMGGAWTSLGSSRSTITCSSPPTCGSATFPSGSAAPRRGSNA